MVLCRELKLFSQAAVAVDSSKFKAVNSRDRNFTPAKIEKRKQQIEESIQRYLSALDTADRTMPLLEFGPQSAHLKDKLSALRKQMRRMDEMKERLKAEPDEQLSLSDPDARSMMSQAKGTGLVGYNVQTAVDARHHLIVDNEVTNVGSDRAQLSKMALAAREAMGKQKLQAYADRGYLSGLEIKACDEAGIKVFVLPEKNKRDLVDVPKEILDTLDVRPVSTVEEVLKIALQPGPAVTPAQLEVTRPVTTPATPAH